MKKKIQEKIEFLEGELAKRQKENSDKLNEFMRQTGILDFVNENRVQDSLLQGKIDSLKEILLELEDEDQDEHSGQKDQEDRENQKED